MTLHQQHGSYGTPEAQKHIHHLITECGKARVTLVTLQHAACGWSKCEAGRKGLDTETGKHRNHSR